MLYALKSFVIILYSAKRDLRFGEWVDCTHLVWGLNMSALPWIVSSSLGAGGVVECRWWKMERMSVVFLFFLLCSLSAMSSLCNLESIFTVCCTSFALHPISFKVAPLLVVWVVVSFPLSSNIPSNHAHLFKKGFDGRTGPFFTLMLGIRQTSVVSWREELTGASRAQPINIAQYDCSKDP